MNDINGYSGKRGKIPCLYTTMTLWRGDLKSSSLSVHWDEFELENNWWVPRATNMFIYNLIEIT